MTTIGHIDDHVLLLQLERANEVLEDRVDFIEEGEGDSCSCDCAESDLDRLHERVSDGNDRMLEMASLITELTERVIQLERGETELLDALSRALVQ